MSWLLKRLENLSHYSFYKRIQISPIVRYESDEDNVKVKLFKQVKEKKIPKPKAGNKVSIIGGGFVGLACATSILYQGYSNDICIIDANKKKVKGEVEDLLHGTVFLRNARIVGSDDFGETAGSRVCVITAGISTKKNESRLALLKKNAEVYQKIIPVLVKHNPKAIFVVVTNPVDIMTYVTHKLSKFPETRVIGTGTLLDTARFQHFLSKIFNVSPKSTNGWVIGEHGDTSFPVWSAVTIGNVNLREYEENIGNCKDPLELNELKRKVRKAGYKVNRDKGYSNWAIGLSVADIVKAILFNTHEILTVSSYVNDLFCVNEPVFFSLPRIINGNGASSIVKLNIDCCELAMLLKSSDILTGVQKSLKL